MSVKNTQFTKLEIKILKYVFKHYLDKYNARQIARDLSLNHAHVNKLCNLLEKKNLFLKENMGNSSYYKFNYGNELALNFVKYILDLEKDEFPKYLEVLLYNLNKFNGLINLGCVFGSSIKNDKFNDIDVLLVYDKKYVKDVKKIKDLIRKSELVEKPIRYVEMTDNDLLKNKGDKIFYNILSNSLIFYNAEKYVEVVKCLK